MLSLAFFQSCSDDSKAVPAKMPTAEDYSTKPDQISHDLKVFFVDSSYTKAILTAKLGRVFTERGETLLDSGVRVDFFSKETGARISYLTADSARIDDKTKNMLARGNVVVVSDSSATRLETSLLEWDNTRQKVYSTENVKITTPTQTIRGRGFISDVQLTDYRIFKMSGEQR